MEDGLKKYLIATLTICSVIALGGMVWFFLSIANGEDDQVGYALCIMLFMWGVVNTNVGFARLIYETKNKK